MVKRSKVIIVCTMFLLSLSICGCGGLAGKLEKNYDQYNNGEISYEQASEKLDKFRELADGSEAQSKIDEQENELIELRASKYAFDAAGQSMTDGNYETALSQYERVIEKDTNYEAAQTGIDTAGQKYLETVHEQGKAYVDDGDYQKAIKYYDASERVYDDGSAATWITETNAEYKTDLENKLAEYSKNKEYQEAIVCCDELRDYFGDDSYGTKRLELENAWSDQVLVDSEKLLSEEEYAEASSMVKIAMAKVTDTGALQEQLDRIIEYTPVDITTLTPTKESIPDDFTVEKWTTTDKTNTGEDGYTGVKIEDYCFTGGIFDNEKIKYRRYYQLDGKYDTLTGILAVHADSEKYDEYKDEFGISVYVLGDDNELLYTYKDVIADYLHCDEPPVSFTIDVSGQSQIMIAYVSVVGLNVLQYYDASMTGGLLNMELKKTYEPK